MTACQDLSEAEVRGLTLLAREIYKPRFGMIIKNQMLICALAENDSLFEELRRRFNQPKTRSKKHG